MTTHSDQSYLDLIFIIISDAKRPISKLRDTKKSVPNHKGQVRIISSSLLLYLFRYLVIASIR